MEEVPLVQPTLLVLHDRDALSVEDEKVLLHRFRVVAAIRLPRLHDLDVDADVGPGHALRLELDEGGSARGSDRGCVGEIRDEWLVHRHTILGSRRSPDKLPPCLMPWISTRFRPSAWSRRRSRRRWPAYARTRPATSRTSTTTPSRWSLPTKRRRRSTGCTGSSRRSAPSSSRPARSTRRRSRSRTSAWPTSSTKAVCRST